METSSFIQTFQDHSFLLFLAASFFGGEELMIPLAFIAGTGVWDFKTLFAGCFLGTLIADNLWFLLGRHGLQKTKFFQKHKSKYEKVVHFLNKISKKELLILLVTKFLYGTRIFTLLHFGIIGTPKKKFFLMNTLVIILWLPWVLSLGWFAGKGSTLFLDLYQHPTLLLMSIGILIFIFHKLMKSLGNTVLPEEIQS